MTGAELIAAERQRQIDAEGYDPAHDDEHDDGEMLRAALCYVVDAEAQAHGYPVQPTPPGTWPWRREDWKPGTAARMLVKAGALIAAEIDRIERRTR